MFAVCRTRFESKVMVAVMALLLLVAAGPTAAYARKKPKNVAPSKPVERDPKLTDFNLSKIVFPNPPSIARVKTIGYYIGEPIPKDTKKAIPKGGWMDRLAGSKPVRERKDVKIPFQLIAPNGIAEDSKGLVYAADYRVGAVFVFNPETQESHLIANHRDANFKLINGLAIDDSDRLFIADSGFHHVLVYNIPANKVEDVIEGGLITPNGLAVDNDNRYLYVADSDLDQVLVYDLDSLKLLRKIGTTGKDHHLTAPGELAWPTGVAVDPDGNLYVTDTLNDRVEIFDADGQFVSAFGKECDAPGCMQRPKGIAIDSDGHVWVVDTMMARVQVYDRQGRVMISFGGFGKYPGEFSDLAGIMIDKNNRVFTSEMQPGRIQMFRYITDAEAAAEKQRREAERMKKAEAREAPADKPASQATPSAVQQMQKDIAARKASQQTTQ